MGVKDEIAQSRRKKPFLQNDAQLLPRQESSTEEQKLKINRPVHLRKSCELGTSFWLMRNLERYLHFKTLESNKRKISLKVWLC